MFFLFFYLILISSDFQVQAKNTCNDDCLTKTYCVSSGGSIGCSKDNLVTVQFKVIPDGARDYIQMQLTGYKIGSDDEKTLKVSFGKSGQDSNTYSCYKSPVGSTYARYERGSVSQTTGSSYYTDGFLYCTWIFNRFDSIWPSYKGFYVDMTLDDSQSISLFYDSQNFMVASDASQIPIYHVQYLKCCNKVHGNDAVALTFDQTKGQLNYLLYSLKDKKKSVSIILTRKDGVKLTFTCAYTSQTFSGSIRNGTHVVILSDEQIPTFNIDLDRCSWSSKSDLGDSKLQIDASTSIFDLQVSIDGDIVYTEKDVALKNSSNSIKFNMMIFFLVFLHILINF